MTGNTLLEMAKTVLETNPPDAWAAENLTGVVASRLKWEPNTFGDTGNPTGTFRLMYTNDEGLHVPLSNPDHVSGEYSLLDINKLALRSPKIPSWYEEWWGGWRDEVNSKITAEIYGLSRPDPSTRPAARGVNAPRH